MTARSTKEWIGKTPDTPVPPRVRLRVRDKDQSICQCGCGLPIFNSDRWDTDHVKALVNGGENRESNLRTLLRDHHKLKTAEDIREKSTIYRKRVKHLGLKKAKGQPMPGSRTSGFKRKMDGTVERR